MKNQLNSINEIFNNFINKAVIIDSYYGLKQEEKNEVSEELAAFISLLRDLYIKEWKMVEFQEKIITHLENELINKGANIDEVRACFKS